MYNGIRCALFLLVPGGTMQIRPVSATQINASSGTITMTPTGATIRPGTRIVRQRSPVTMPQGVKVVGGTPGTQPQIISIPGGQQKTIISASSVSQY
jgi:hypothetical protein